MLTKNKIDFTNIDLFSQLKDLFSRYSGMDIYDAIDYLKEEEKGIINVN